MAQAPVSNDESIEQISEQAYGPYADLNERQGKAIKFLKENKSIKTKMYMKINNVSLGTARLDINEMLKFDYIKKIGSFRGAYYILSEEKK